MKKGKVFIKNDLKRKTPSTKLFSYVIIAGLLVIHSTLFGQSDTEKVLIQAATNVSVLNQLAVNWKIKALQEKQLAEQWAISKGYPISGNADGNFFELQCLDSVTGMPQYNITHNINSANTISTNKVWFGTPLNLTGIGFTIGEWDAPSVSLTQYPIVFTELGTRLTQVDISTDVTKNDPHPLHVTGTMIAAGVNEAAQGMASQASVKLYDYNYDNTEMASFAANYNLLSNHSYGKITGWENGNWGSGIGWYWFGNTNISSVEASNFGLYSNFSKQWDIVANNAKYYLIVKSAGNDRGEGPTSGATHFDYNYTSNTWVSSTDIHQKDGGTVGYDCLDQYSVAKNILTVGAVTDITNPLGWTSASDVVMTSFSSWGPTDDGRIKPDIVANGECVFSLWNGNEYNGCDGSCNGQSYCSKSGTSMAAPSVTGSLTLLQEHYKNTHPTQLMKASTLKALVIQTADEAGSSTGPDYIFGWGLMNTKKATDVISDDAFQPETIQESTLNQGKWNTIKFYYDGIAGFIKSSIVWNDPAGTPISGQLNPTTLMIVNDLDIRIVRDYDNHVFYPYTLNPASPSSPAKNNLDNFRDNVEQVYIDNPSIGDYTIIISHKGFLYSLEQEYSIITNVKTGPVGIEDNVTIGGYNCSGANPSIVSLGDAVQYCAFFDDQDPYGDYPVSWDWNIGLIHSQGIYVMSQTTLISSSSSWNTSIPSAIPDYNWARDADGNIMGKISVNCIDNDGYSHTNFKDFSLVYKPNMPLIKSEQISCSTVKLSYISNSATSYKIYYGTISGGPYNGTGIIEGSSPISTTTPNEITLTGLTQDLQYYFVITGISTKGESVYSNEVSNIMNCYHTISGAFTYNNIAQTPLANVTVKLMSGSNIVASTVTNTLGEYTIESVPDGVYNIVATTIKTWGGVTATDVLKIKRHIAGLELFNEPIKYSAADANNSTTINATDVLKVQRRIAGLDLSFSRPDWNFEKSSLGGNSITINGADVTQNFNGLCTGDVNGSYAPSLVKQNFNYASLQNDGQINIDANQEFELPVKIANQAEIGACQLFLNYNSDLFDVKDIKMDKSNEDLIFNVQNGVIKIVWASINPIYLKTNDILLTLKLKAKGTISSHTEFILNNESELSNAEGSIFENANLLIPSIIFNAVNSIEQTKSENFEFNIYPNPVKNELIIETNSSTKQNCEILNVLSDVVYTSTVNKKTTFNTSHLSSGVYFVKIYINKLPLVKRFVKD